MYGMPRRVTQVTLPGTLGSSSFSPQGAMRFGQTVSFTTLPKTTVTDAVGNATVYEFTDMDAEIVDVDATSKSVSAEWMVYYLTSEIHHYQGAPGTGTLLGTEKYEFDKASGLSLWRATDFSGNTTTWEYGDALSAQPAGLGKDAASITMTKWADPTAKIDALNRREDYAYGPYRVMNQIDDPYATVTDFTVDGLGRRKFKNVQQGGTTSLIQERYDYNNQRFKAFQTGTTKLAFASVSGQAWETDLATGYLPDDRGRLWREIVDPQELKLTTEHTYDFNNNKTSTLDARGNRTRFAYDKLNRLIEVTYPSAGTRSGEAPATKQNWYDLNGNKAAEIDEEGHYTIFHYDALNRRIKTIRDMDGQGLPSRNADGLVEEANKGTATGNDLVTEVRYDSVNNLTHTIDPNGNVTFTVHDAIRRPVHVFTGLTLAEAADLGTATNAAAASTEKTHTEFLYIDSGLNLPVGGTVKANPGGSAFDSSGFKPTLMIRHDAVLTSTGTITLHTCAAYDALYRPLRTETEYEANTYAVSSTAYGSIAAGKEALQTTSTDDRDKVTVTIMDGLLRATSVTDAHGTTLAATSQTVYSSTGLVWKTIDPLLRETETEYDAAARPVAVWQPDPVTGLVNRSTPNDPLAGSPRTQTAYDKNHNVTVTINPLGYRWEYEYDARNRKTVERQPTVTSTEIVNGQPQESVLQNPVIQTAFDGVGNVIAVTDARNHITRTFHDFAYRVTYVLTNPVTGNPSTDPQTPGTHDILTHTGFDANGNALEVTDGNGNATRNAYDALNRLVATATNPNDGDPNAPPAAPKTDDIVVSNQYDDAGNLVKVTDGEGHITGFRWDGMSRKTRTLWDEGSAVQRTEQASYDGVVQLTRVRNPGLPEEQTTTYQYDALNRLENILYTGAATDNRHYEHDLVGNLLQVSYPNETAARKILRGSSQVFDKLNRLKEETSAGAAHVHTYDKANNRRTTEYAATGRTLASTYDKLNRLLTLTENGTATTSYGYDLSGNVTRKVLPNQTVTQNTFDALNRKLTEDTRTTGGALISSFDYSTPAAGYPSGHDNAGNILQLSEFYGRAEIKARTVVNTYDRTYRLASETAAEAGGSTTLTEYLYDKNCNRTEKKETINSGIPKIWTHTLGTTTDGYNSNQIKSVSDGTITTIFLYDLNGNRSSRTDGTKTQIYTWDYDNRLTQVVDSVLGTFAYTYDHRTRRVGRDESNAGGQIDELSFSGGLSVQEYQSNQPTPFVETIRGSDYGGGIGGILYTIRDGNSRSYNAYNSRGDVVSRTDDTAAITWQASYAAFGSETQQQGATLERQASNTKDKDRWGANNEGRRFRDLEFDIYLSRDPLGHVDGPNEYVHVRQNPWSAFDPLGLATTFQDEDTHTSSTDIPEPEYQPAPASTATVDVGGSSARDLNELAAASAAAEADPVQSETDWSHDHGPRLWAATASPSELNEAADSGRHGDKLTKLFRQNSQAASNAAHNWLIIAGMAEAAGWGLSFLEPTPFGESAMAGRTLAKRGASLNPAFQKGFASHGEMVKYLGPAGKGQAWHHIVEQTPANIAKFGPERIHNINNIVAAPHGSGTLHNKISGFYSSRAPGGGRIRDWVGTKSFEEQYDFGMKTMQKFYEP
jgi:YD repeat-containing protein